MMMKGVAALLCILSICGAQKWKQETSAWDHEEHGHAKTCSNLTQVLDNWKYAIITQVKDLLVNNPASVLPEYSRIPPLSDALSDLYRQFNSLKDELGTLTNKFDRVEAFVDDLQAGKFPPRPALAAPQRPMERFPPPVALRSPLRAQRRAPARGNGPGGQMLTRTRGRRVPQRT